MNELAPVLAALATLVTAAGVFVNAVATARRDAALARKVEAVHDEVVTANGRTLGALADAREGRRIEADVDRSERSHAEQGYVDRLHDSEH